MKSIFIILSISILSNFSIAQSKDSLFIRSIFTETLTNDDCYENLRYLCKQIGPRLSGSENAEKAVKYTELLMKEYGFDKVYLQEVKVPHWRRLNKATGEIRSGNKTSISVCALGGSIATPKKGIQAEVIEVKSFAELDSLGSSKVSGKIVFFNRAFDASHIETFAAYSGAVNQRGRGASMAAKYGAVACIVRSMSYTKDPYPHTGAMRYDAAFKKIPAAAVSTIDADVLSQKIKNPNTTLFLQFDCDTLEDKISYNVIGELKGSVNPEEIITVGGHLDSWDLAEGAHDDGAGCVQSIEVLRSLKVLKYKPKHTIRVVLFMNEENGLRGGLKYAEVAKQQKEVHLAAIESDAGGFTPRGFDIDADDQYVKKIQSWQNLLAPYGLYEISKGGSGADIGPLKGNVKALIGFRPDSQRYFDIHHSANDTFETVNKRELQMGAASMTALIYLIDQYGF
jgi:carboxypeptidase Q